MDDKSYEIFKMFNNLRKIDGLNKQRLKMHGLHNLETLILLNLYRYDDLTQKDLVEKLMAPKQSVNTIVLNLKERKLLETASLETDKRVKKLVLTEHGKDEAYKIIEPLREGNISIYDALGKDKLDEISKNLTYLIEVLEESLAKEEE